MFELLIRLFFVFVLGLRNELVGWRRGEARRMARSWASDGVAADFATPWAMGPVAVSFGPVEAQGRGSLHPHILVWLILAAHPSLLELLLRDKAAFKHRLRQWMMQVVAAVVATQESATTGLPKYTERLQSCRCISASIAIGPERGGICPCRWRSGDGHGSRIRAGRGGRTSVVLFRPDPSRGGQRVQGGHSRQVALAECCW